eukprot:TRINITY_DN47389_c0_g1_i1.p1 TRINITY_DN47389_c0_g1~~TRINITY_DN47389_c0_g1_i1.p1  ORF type:complete len:425 (+),score=163.18 TRINITY_DN47389_c0_g1_i1:57-1277(+)
MAKGQEKKKGMSKTPLLLIAVGIGMSVLLTSEQFRLPDEEDPTPAGALVHAEGGEAGFLKVKDEPPAAAFSTATQSYNFGRWRRPLPVANLHELTVAQKVAQKKEWHWVGVAAGDLFVGVGMMQLGYSSNIVLYWLDAATGATGMHEKMIPLAALMYGAKFSTDDGEPSSSVRGCSAWTAFGPTARLCFDPSAGLMRVQISTQTTNGALAANLTMDASDGVFSLVYPLGKRRPAIVTKLAGSRAAGTVTIADRTTQVDGVGMVDWTRALPRRLTVWNWAAASWKDASGVRLGMHLSRGCYEDSNGHSIEAFYSVDGKVTPFDDQIVFKVPAKDRLLAEDWHVESKRGVVKYTFTPVDRVVGEFHLGVLDGGLHHIWGTMTGRLVVDGKTYEFNKIPGVIEEHYALW